MGSDLVRKRIVTTANDFFSRFGFHKTTMHEIAKRIHKAKGALYYYFKSKETLYSEVLKQDLSAVKIRLEETILNEPDPTKALETYLNTRMDLLSQSKNYQETLLADFNEKYSFTDEVRKEFESFEKQQIRHLLSKSQESGDLIFTDLSITTDYILLSIRSFEISLLVDGKKEEYSKAFRELLVVLFKGLRYNVAEKH